MKPVILLLTIFLACPLLAADADLLDAAYANLKAAEAKKDADGVIEWSAKTVDLAKKVTAADQAEHAKDVAKYSEYALYAVAAQESDPAKTMKLVEALGTVAP